MLFFTLSLATADLSAHRTVQRTLHVNIYMEICSASFFVVAIGAIVAFDGSDDDNVPELINK